MSLLDGGYIDCRRQTGGQKIIFDSVYSKRNVHHIWEGWSFVVLGVLILLGYGCQYNLHDNLPKALGNSDLLYNPHSFIAERAWKDLKILTNFGPRAVGTYSNEVLAVDFLKREISYIKQLANTNQRIELDVQVVSGTYWTGFKPYGMTTMYRNVQNVVVKLHGEYKSNERHQNDKALLLNCHFDTVPGSPGASDDAASCVVMIEILRVLSRSEKRLKHSIVFLFNGAEETGLQASHGFITKHKWASEIKAFINLESVGSGGKELLFQNNRNNSWLIQGPVSIYQGDGKLCKNTVFHNRTKHVHNRHHFIRETIERGAINMEYLPTDAIPEDVLTKALYEPKHIHLIFKIHFEARCWKSKNVFYKITLF